MQHGGIHPPHHLAVPDSDTLDMAQLGPTTQLSELIELACRWKVLRNRPGQRRDPGVDQGPDEELMTPASGAPTNDEWNSVKVYSLDPAGHLGVFTARPVTGCSYAALDRAPRDLKGRS